MSLVGARTGVILCCAYTSGHVFLRVWSCPYTSGKYNYLVWLEKSSLRSRGKARYVACEASSGLSAVKGK